jgi:transketolase
MDAARHGELEKIALEIRKDVVRMLGVARAGGYKKSVGIVDILVYLYWECMKISPGERNCRQRDRFVLGKGAATPALYACLAKRGFFGREELWSYSRLGAMLQGYPDIRTPGVDAPWGSSGGGIGLACGLAESIRADGLDSRAFCLTDEEEMRVGVAWESIISAACEELGNLVVLVHANNQAGKISVGLRSFGWMVLYADGSDYESLDSAFGALDYGSGIPKAVVFDTKIDDFPGGESDKEHDEPLSRDDIDKVISLLDGETPDAGPK